MGRPCWRSLRPVPAALLSESGHPAASQRVVAENINVEVSTRRVLGRLAHEKLPVAGCFVNGRSWRAPAYCTAAIRNRGGRCPCWPGGVRSEDVKALQNCAPMHVGLNSGGGMRGKKDRKR